MMILMKLFERSELKVSNEITLDYDVKFESFLGSGYHRRLVDYLERRGIGSFCMRKSSSRNVHVAFSMRSPCSLFESLLIRRHLKDDETRILVDMDRYYNTMNSNATGRLWMFKIRSDGKILRAKGWRTVRLKQK